MITIDDLKKIDETITNEILEFAKNNNLLTDDVWPIYDGLYSPELYWNSPLRIMWILKEPYDDFDNETGKPIGGDWSITKDLFHTPSNFGNNKTGEMVIYSTYGIINNKQWNEMEYIHKDPDMCKCLQKIAYINLSKMPAYTTSSDSSLWKKYDKWKEITLKQIKGYEPNVLIFGNTFKYFENDLKETHLSNMSITQDKNMINFYKNEERILIDAWHPGKRFSNKEKESYVNSLVMEINNWYSSITKVNKTTKAKYLILTKLACFLVSNRMKMKGSEVVSFLNTNNFQTSYGTSYQGGRGVYKLIRDCWHYYSNKNDKKTRELIEKAFVNNQGYPAFW